MLNKELINRKFSLIIQDIEALKPLGELDLERYREDPKNEVLAERYLERIINRVIDVNYHIVKEIGGYAPTDYTESFKDVAKLKILPADFASELSQAAGFRNILVHDYDDVDETIVYENIKKCVGQMPQYMKYVREFIKNMAQETRV